VHSTARVGSGQSSPSVSLQVDERLHDIEKYGLFLDGKDEIQVQAAFKALPSLFKSHGRACFDQLGQRIKSALAAATEETSSLLAASLAEIFTTRALQVLSPVLQSKSVTPQIFHMVTFTMHSSRCIISTLAPHHSQLQDNRYYHAAGCNGTFISRSNDPC
jgi:hypothetical protein